MVHFYSKWTLILLVITTVSGVPVSYGQTFSLHSRLFGIGNGSSGGSLEWLALSDYNSDGRIDVYHQGSLFRQSLDGTFIDVVLESGFQFDSGSSADHSVGATWADANGDGLLELLRFRSPDRDVGISEIHLNLDGNSFMAVYSPLFIRILHGINAAVWRDFNGDGYLDVLASGDQPILFSGNEQFEYADVTDDWGPDFEPESCGLAVSDMDQDGDPDVFNSGCSSQALYRNEVGESGDFADVTLESGIESLPGAQEAVWADINNDGWPDLFVAYVQTAGPLGQNSAEDKLYINQKNGHFVETAEAAGLGTTSGQSTLGVLAADFNNDGWVDFFLNRDERIQFYVNDGDGTFTLEANSDLGSFPVNPGMAFGDINRDGWLDVVLRNSFRPFCSIGRIP